MLLQLETNTLTLAARLRQLGWRHLVPVHLMGLLLAIAQEAFLRSALVAQQETNILIHLVRRQQVEWARKVLLQLVVLHPRGLFA